MTRYLIGAVLALLTAQVAGAQVLPGDPVDTGIGAAVRNSRSPPLFGISQDAQRYTYVPDSPRSTGSHRPPVRDPWAGLRTAPLNYPIDKHRPL